MKFSTAFVKKVSQTETKTVKFEVTGSPKQLEELEKLFGWVQYLGNIGHSGSMKLFVDGDGSARLKIRADGKDVEKPEDYKNESSDKDIEYEVGLD